MQKPELINKLALLNSLSFSNIYSEFSGIFESKNIQFIEIIKTIFFNNNTKEMSKSDYYYTDTIGILAAPIVRYDNQNYKCKEIAVINSFPIDCSFSDSILFKSISNIIFIFYEPIYLKEAFEWPIIISGNIEFSEEEKIELSVEWNYLFNKIIKSDTILENDTKYLTIFKNTNDSSNKAIAFKPFLLNKAYNKIQRTNTRKRLEDLLLSPNSNSNFQEGLEKFLKKRFSFFVGKTPEQIANELFINYNGNAKNALSTLTKALLSLDSSYDINIFIKNGLISKTLRVKSNNKPCESISFPSFKFTDFLFQNWEDSELYNNLYVTKFLFVIYQYIDTEAGVKLVFKGTFIKSFSIEEIFTAKKTWEKTKEMILAGNIVKTNNGKTRTTYFPGSTENEIVHVRPHAKNSDDVYPLPYPDKLTNVTNYTKHSFWLNQSYLQKIITDNFKQT